MSHTPGPWRYAEVWRPPVGTDPQGTNADGNVFWGYSITGSHEYGGMILPVLGTVHNFPDQCEANARLIASAPDLLEALRDFVAMGEQYEWDKAMTGRDLLMRNARAAIAKATEGR